MIAAPFTQLDSIIQYYSFPALLLVVYFYIFLRFLENHNAKLWFVLGLLNAMMIAGRITAGIYLLVPMVYCAVHYFLKNGMRFRWECWKNEWSWHAILWWLGGFGLACGTLYGLCRNGMAIKDVSEGDSRAWLLLWNCWVYVKCLVLSSWRSVLLIGGELGAVLLFRRRWGKWVSHVPMVVAISGLFLFLGYIEFRGTVSFQHIKYNLVGLLGYITLMLVILPFDFSGLKKPSFSLDATRAFIFSFLAFIAVIALGTNTECVKVAMGMPWAFVLFFVCYDARARGSQPHMLWIYGLFVLLVLHGIYGMRYPYRDATRERMTSSFRIPALSHVRTTPERCESIERIYYDISTELIPGKTLWVAGNQFVYPLILKMPSFESWYGTYEKIDAYFSNRKQMPDYVLLPRANWGYKQERFEEIRQYFDSTLNPGYELVKNNADYRLYRKR